MSARPKHSVNRPDYRQLADVKVPKINNRTCRRDGVGSFPDSTFYCLRVLEEGQENKWVKVRYVGYSDKYDEWRRMDKIVTVDHYKEENYSDFVPSQLPSMAAVKFCLLEELANRIKSLLLSSRKTSPVCSVVLSFDSLHFDSLVVRGTRKDWIFEGWMGLKSSGHTNLNQLQHKM